MNVKDLSQVLDQLDTKAQALLRLNSSSLEQQSVTSLRNIVAQMDAIAHSCEHIRDRILDLTAESLPDPLQDEVCSSQGQLDRIIQQCRGETIPSASVKKVRSDLNQWRIGFSVLLKKIADVERRRTMQRDCTRLYQATKTLQSRALSLRIDHDQKLDVLKQLLDVEQGLLAVQHHLDMSDRTGLQEQQRLESFKRAIADLGSTYGLLKPTAHVKSS
ncbi:hypothetical protein [Leptolyngbya sp. CCY15150]|uniref:hypothetical protein n=1 Tax=Leptolyngbya sp. CCY15150 TaxID=2767772 RepID=UPI00195153F6|nr:hypothetical protein [Leptolyngbya sp. CCY15150]